MKKRDDHVLPSNDVVSFMDLDKVKAEGGFFRKGELGSSDSQADNSTSVYFRQASALMYAIDTINC